MPKSQGGPGFGQTVGLFALALSIVAGVAFYLSGADSLGKDEAISIQSPNKLKLSKRSVGGEAEDLKSVPGPATAAPPSNSGAASGTGGQAASADVPLAASSAATSSVHIVVGGQASMASAALAAASDVQPDASDVDADDPVDHPAVANAGGDSGDGADPAESLGGKCYRQVFDFRDRNRECKRKYRNIMVGMAPDPGIDVIFGANDGLAYEPASLIGYWKRVPHHTRVLVEPVPTLFSKLQKNLAVLPTKPLFVNKAVRLNGSAPFLQLYCWNTTTVDSFVIDGVNRLPPEVRPPEAFWNALCSTEEKQLWGSSHILDSDKYKVLSKEEQERVAEELKQHVVRYEVPAATPEEIVLQDVVASGYLDPKDIKYVQVDVERMDKEIVTALPFGKNGFKPRAVLFEGCYEHEPGNLKAHGYETCCCVNIYGVNTLAYLP